MTDEVEIPPSKNLTLFNPAFIDDYGLTPEEFRVFARIMRRSAGEKGCYESIPNMALRLGMGERSVRRAIQVLKECGAINVSQNAGSPMLITFNPSGKWRPSLNLATIRERLFGRHLNKDRERKIGGVGKASGVGNDRGVVAEMTGGVVSEMTPKGTPYKVHQEGTENAVHTGRGLSLLLIASGLKKFSPATEREWTQHLDLAFENGFTAEEFVACFSDLKVKKNYRILPQYVTDALPTFIQSRKPKEMLPSTEQKIAESDAHRAVLRQAPKLASETVN